MTLLQKNVSVVLVEPGESMNIGSVARAMSNLGFDELHLVAPPRFDRERARITACWGDGVLEKAVHHPDLASALSDRQDVIGFSTQSGKNRPPPMTLREWVTEELARPASPIALVFGPEDTGLTREQIERCRITVRIPSSAENPAFNLAQSVLIVLYELSRDAQLDRGENTAEPRATWEQFEQLDRLIYEVSVLSGFVHEGSPAGVVSLMRNLVRRMQPSSREVQILMGIFGSALGVMQGRIPLHRSPVDKS